MHSTNKEISRRFTELFGTDDLALADSVFTADVVLHGTAGDGELHGIDTIKGFIAAYRRAFPDAHSSVEDQVAEDDKVVTRWHARGTHTGPLGPFPATGRAFEMDGVTIERIAEGRIAEIWVARDELGLLGRLHSHALATAWARSSGRRAGTCLQARATASCSARSGGAPGKRVGRRIPGYTASMAKVMVSMPDDLLSEVDAEASRLGTSRSAVLRQFADSALRGRRTDRAAAMAALLRHTARHGGAAAERVKATRPA
jgi:steroid delta-isomerase-like uncharacterized protein